MTNLEIIIDFMRRRNLSQNKLAVMLGVHNTAVGKWVNGTRNPTKTIMILINLIDRYEP